MACGTCKKSGHNSVTCPRNVKKPCCNNPKQEYHRSWQDETGRCANCGRHLSFGSVAYFAKLRREKKNGLQRM
jgi:hypothetical protein